MQDSVPHNTLNLATLELKLPAFLPDATHGYVKAVDMSDLTRLGIKALMMNTFALMQKPGVSVIKAMGGLHKYSGWPYPIFTDSGGFQSLSIIYKDPKAGSISSEGLCFKPSSGKKILLSPEKSIQKQMALDSDLLFCLDDCPPDPANFNQQQAATERTIAWAKRCRSEFDNICNQKELGRGSRPLLFGIVQGGNFPELRKTCAEALLEIGFDGYGYGGWPLDSHGTLLTDSLELCRSLIPNNFPMHALGVGHPESIRRCVQLGYQLLDSSLATKDARHGRLYRWKDAGTAGPTSKLEYLYLEDEKHMRCSDPISSSCSGLCCQNYSLGYIHHLYQSKDALAQRLASIHNLSLISALMQELA